MPSQVASAVAGVPVRQLSRTCPSTQLLAPVAAQAPTPQLVAAGAKSSSIEPSQSSSTPSQVASVVADAVAWQLSRTCPSTQLVAPMAAQAPTPQLVAAGAKSSSIEPSQSSSTPSHVLSIVAFGTQISGGFCVEQSVASTLTP